MVQGKVSALLTPRHLGRPRARSDEPGVHLTLAWGDDPAVHL